MGLIHLLMLYILELCLLVVEGSLEGIPSIGFSLLDYSHKADFSESESFIKKITKSVLVNGLPDGVCLNVNIPKSEKGKEIQGIKICRQANANWEEEFDERKDPKGENILIATTGKFVNFDKGEDTDEWVFKNHYISIVPVQFDVTAHNAISKIKNII